LTKQGGVCAVVGTSCYTYIDQNQAVNTDLQSIWNQMKILHQVTQDNTSWGFQELWDKLTSWLPNLAWLKQLFMAIVIVLGIVVCFGARCFMWMCMCTNDGYKEWKRHQLRWKVESGKYFRRT
ncbi:ERVV2 protein, partial [Smithornis capensis]|nr:ERVV2 protein [Smithornis capensis]